MQIPQISPLFLTGVLCMVPASLPLIGRLHAEEVPKVNHAVRVLASSTQPVEPLSFRLEGEEWVLITVGADVKGGEVVLSLNEGEPILKLTAATRYPEVMRRLPAGEYRLKVAPAGGATVVNVIVKRIPELVFFSIDEVLQQQRSRDYYTYRTYDQLKERGYLRHFNVITCETYLDADAYARQVADWRSEGKRWVGKTSLPKDGEAMGDIEKLWNTPMRNPNLDGVLVDEFSRRLPSLQYFPYWGSVLPKLARQPEWKGKDFYGFCGFNNAAKKLVPLAKGIMQAGQTIAPEAYIRTPEVLRLAPQYMRDWKAEVPGVERSMVLFTAPINATHGLSFHVNPSVNYKVFLEDQVAMLATDPAFEGLKGMGIWVVRYMDDDVLNWYVRLIRHYFIDGKTERLSAESLMLPYLVNPGFEQGEVAWTFSRAEPDSMVVEGEGIIPFVKRAGYSSVPEKAKVLYTRRSAKAPNRFSQKVAGLTPGRLYHLKAYAIDLQDPLKDAPIAGSLSVTGAKMLEEGGIDKPVLAPAMSTRQPTRSAAPQKVDEEAVDIAVKGDIFTNIHHFKRLFIPDAGEVTITISDWVGDDTPGGPAGQELAWDFIELAPDESLSFPEQ